MCWWNYYNHIQKCTECHTLKFGFLSTNKSTILNTWTIFWTVFLWDIPNSRKLSSQFPPVLHSAVILYMRFIYKNALMEGFLTYRSLCNLRRVATILFHKLKSPLTRAINIGVMDCSVLIQQMTWVITSSSQHLYTTQRDPVHCKFIHALHKGSLAPHCVTYKQCKHVASSTYHYCWHIKVKISPQIYHKSGSHTQILGAKSATQS
jgi:hypothetical protein